MAVHCSSTIARWCCWQWKTLTGNIMDPGSLPLTWKQYTSMNTTVLHIGHIYQIQIQYVYALALLRDQLIIVRIELVKPWVWLWYVTSSCKMNWNSFSPLNNLKKLQNTLCFCLLVQPAKDMQESSPQSSAVGIFCPLRDSGPSECWTSWKWDNLVGLILCRDQFAIIYYKRTVRLIFNLIWQSHIRAITYWISRN